MRTLNSAMLVICLLCSSCSKKSEEAPTTSSNAQQSIFFTEDYHLRGEDQWYVCFGTRFENRVEILEFVLFQKGSRDWQSEERVISRTTDDNIHEGYLIDDSQKEIQLPTDTQLYQILDGKLLSSPYRVTLSQLKSFLETEPEQYTIKRLLSFNE